MVYGSPVLQAAVGIDPAGEQPQRKAAKSSAYRSAVAGADRRAEIADPAGGLRECLARGLLYVGMARGGPDERGFAGFGGSGRSKTTSLG